MTNHRLAPAMLLLVVGNGLALVSDAIIKSNTHDVPVFQFVVIRIFATLLLLAPFVFHWVNFKQFFLGGKLHLVRAHVSLFGVGCMIISLNTLPLATANAIFYAAPVIVMLLAVIVFKERLTLASFVSVVSGFVGILVILQPNLGQWQSLTALGVAFSLAINIMLIRKLPEGQSMVHVLMLGSLLMLPMAGLIAFFNWKPVTWSLILSAFGSAFFILCYNVSLLIAYRWVSAKDVTAAEYTGIVWAVLVGWIFYNEPPDLPFVLGTLMIVLPLLWIALAEQRMFRRHKS